MSHTIVFVKEFHVTLLGYISLMKRPKNWVWFYSKVSSTLFKCSCLNLSYLSWTLWANTGWADAVPPKQPPSQPAILSSPPYFRTKKVTQLPYRCLAAKPINGFPWGSTSSSVSFSQRLGLYYCSQQDIETVRPNIWHVCWWQTVLRLLLVPFSNRPFGKYLLKFPNLILT